MQSQVQMVDMSRYTGPSQRHQVKASPAIIDVEASGFGSDSYPIEVGVVTDEGNRFCRLIRPLAQWTHWSEEAEALHGISRDVLFDRGVDCRQVCEELNSLLKDQTVYSDGWVVDQPWLIKLYYAAHMSMSFRISPLEMILSEQQMNAWSETKSGILTSSTMRRHRASTDAEIIQRTYQKTYAQQFVS